MEFTNVHLVATLGFALAVIFGAIANRTNFCTMGAVSDWVNMGLKGRFGAWVLAMGIAVAGAQILELTGLVDIGSSLYRTTSFGLGGYIIGGLLFGIGMTLSGGCGQRTLVRVGSGNLKSLVVFLVLALSAYMTLRGLLAVVRVSAIEPMTIDLAAQGISDQGLASVLGGWFGFEATSVVRAGIGLLVAAILILWALKQEALRESADNMIAGIVIGLIIVAAWVVTGLIGVDDFDPVPVEAMTFIAPSGNTLSYLMTYTGATINFGIAIVFGVIVGSFLYSIFSRTFAIETFTDRNDMINHLTGGLLMGFGGVLALGCTVGQAISGISTLALGSFIAAFFIIVGSALTMRVQYHRMDDMSFIGALGVGIADVLMPWRMQD
jgi:uncharacterized membrane protein YedE/YeeE